MDAETWQRTREQLEAKMREMNSNLLTDTSKLVEQIRQLATDTTSAEGIKKTPSTFSVKVSNRHTPQR